MRVDRCIGSRAVQRPVHPGQSPGARALGGPGLGAQKEIIEKKKKMKKKEIKKRKEQ